MLNRYGFLGSIRLVVSLIYTKIFFYKARLIRLPFDIRNRRFIKIGRRFTAGFGCRIEAFPLDKNDEYCITIGDNVQINDYVHIGAVGNITIGNNVLMASKIYISDHNHGNYDDLISDHPMSIPEERKAICKPVVIGDNVWLGESVCILPGITIGEGCIVGALSVVTKSIPPYSIAAGNPAKVVKKYDFEINKWIKV
ncbi:putative lipopolysaccharide biosynthesis O-acetyl transferase WbbJ [Flavobacterium palustre]|uniref:Lipopolysaccharide biosynthesis O-acetyl transferase WbbJ n=1 Tax=Flavobacterium palustre TaxID=1476463 RepID=A0ABQ1H8R8_9FLAO|nr:DapH/DapD/GlmU-related protein [Flavobacterium palustre]GGA63246.1 putative lipopolysaccharide biosynthesis O-acetyl transferase WbbJ [Flavobacterium palustre]